MRNDVVPRRFIRQSERARAAGAGFFAVACGLGLAAATPAAAQTAASATGQVSTAPAEESRLGGFDVSFSFSDSTGLNAVGENYRNELSLFIEPRWAVGKVLLKDKGFLSKLVLGGRLVLNRAIAGTDEGGFGNDVNAGPQGGCSDITPSANGGVIDPNQVAYCHPTPNSRRTDYSDIGLSAALPRLATIPRIKVDVSPSVRFTIPISPQSRFSTLRLGTTASLAFGRTLMGDKLRLGYSFGFTKNLHKYTTAGIESEGGTVTEEGGNAYSPISGVSSSNLYADATRVGMKGFNTSFSLSNSISASYKINEEWSVDGLYLWTDGWSYDHSCGVSIAGYDDYNECTAGDVLAAAQGSDVTRRGHRKGQVLWLTANYNWRPWLGFSLAWATWAPRQKPDSTYRQPFVSTDYNSFTSVLFSASTSLDEVLKVFRHESPKSLAVR
jgi:hypothetical protein